MYFDTYSPALLFFVETTSQFDAYIHSEEAWGGIECLPLLLLYLPMLRLKELAKDV